ncbi:hypothetical protein Dda_1825 [Drechslerella dactyloides]|uniref:Uncharacterized protein n=1 Tax=Drechslerella dactyloides TaxID=74499 RepID=A0AAD6J2D1_DREDA|nr:hypothetical protein Dda_1825 [Drechslerella dactyloides]
MHASAVRRAAAAASKALKQPLPPAFLGSPTLPDLAAILPPKPVFSSAQSTGYLKCNRAEATAVLTEIWRATRGVQLDSDAIMTAAVSRVCKAQNFDPANFAPLASLHKSTHPSSQTTTTISRNLLHLGVLLDDPAAIIADATRSLAAARSLPQLASLPAWRKLTALASASNAAEAHELLAKAYTQFKDPARAAVAWRKAADAGSGLACSVLGAEAFMTNDTNTANSKDREDKSALAISWYGKAAERGEVDAYLRLGELLMATDPAEAEHNLLVAAASGSFLAVGKLEELYRSRGDSYSLMADSWKELAEAIEAEDRAAGAEVPTVTEHRNNYKPYRPIRSHKRR